ncbi:MAG: aminomethyl-transferring glycine dehydrogenase subunit GcvPA [Clostridiales bacterium]|nr:aminomethyl-transferring glycine dehydrogenase subunit GcvPA [Clostridiales bacterium]
MAGYVPGTPDDRQAMLESLGVRSVEDLLTPIPRAVRLAEPLHLPPGLGEAEVRDRIAELAERNTRYDAVFRGAGAYRHFIPAVVRSLATREEFVTAYTPYQAEISQGVLQAIFEYQTLICELTGMDAANASVYDGAAAAMEAVRMCAGRGRVRAAVSEGVHPHVRQVLRTGCAAAGIALAEVPLSGGVTDRAAFEGMPGDDIACLLVQSPNYLGCIEDMDTLADAAHTAGALAVASVNPIALGILSTPGEAGFDIAVGEGQALGGSMSFGGPYLGFMACRQPLMRKLPGRIVGQTTDSAGRRGYVLTLQAREQHIRREKAGSNICSNEAHNALTAAVYLTAMGPRGLRETAERCLLRAHELAGALIQVPGIALAFDAPFFHEFVTRHERPVAPLMAALSRKGILGGLPLSEHTALWCATEMNTSAQIERVAAIAAEANR